MSSAIVAGATGEKSLTGVLGREIVNQMGRDPQQWKNIYALSRSKKGEVAPNVQQLHINLNANADIITQQLRGIEAEYIFFAVYLAQNTEKANWRVNGDMLQNFLDALDKTGTAGKIKRIVLVTGAKQYGVHLGPVKVPMLESDPWLDDTNKFPLNFYYRQQNILKGFCDRSGGQTSWTITYPNDVVGRGTGNSMDLATSLAIYAAVNKELGKDLKFPGSRAFYTGVDCFTSAALHARFCEWAATEPKAANQAFNVVNGDTQSWQNLWPQVAKRFGIKVDVGQFEGEPNASFDMGPMPPLALYESEAGLRGTVKSGKFERRIDLMGWSKQEEVKKAWEALASREGLHMNGLAQANWQFLSGVLGRDYDLVLSMSKAREAGWTGYEDTWYSFLRTFEELEAANVIPKCK
ncbi:hypothetical protein S40293_02453 [Stachybotrys chartarum IBT 40293]|nr:hypothetical protein S40293_02453 [Stachybotrys chartarum IBT 40293]